MRGRTNINNDGVAINANPVTKRIREGSIVSGDFVEYYSTPTWIDLAGSIDFQFNIGDYAIALSGGLITAFRDGLRVATYSEYGASAINVVGDWVAFFSAGNSLAGLLSIDNDEFSLVDSITLPSMTDSESNIAAGGGKLMVRSWTDVAVADMASDGSLSNAVKTSGVYSRSAKNFLNYCSDGFYDISVGSQSYTYNEVAVEVIPYIVSNSNTVTQGSHTSVSGAKIYYKTSGENGVPRQIYHNGNVVAITGTYYRYDSRYSGEEYHGQQGYINYINVATGVASAAVVPNHGEALSCISDGKLIASKCYQKSIASGALAYEYRANGIKLYYFDDETFALTEVATKEYAEDTESAVSGNRAGCANNYVYAQLRQTGTEHPGGIRLYYVTGDTMVNIPDSDYVVPYTDGGHPIGVAKVSGSAGDDIPVFIPTPTV